MRFKNIEERYQYRIRSQIEALDEFARSETQMAEYLVGRYRRNKSDMPLEEYRGAAYFINSEFNVKGGSLFLLYDIKERLEKELPAITSETVFDHISYRFKVYGNALQTGGY
jgi:hypothetical protein